MRAVVDTNIFVRALIKPEDTVRAIVSPFEGIPIVGPAEFLAMLSRA
ncbi:MAG: hypothetical protein H0V51_20865 [Chloroflexi bacterium]|nr:hypothetical protein [Chloroflexota bacterium]